MSNAMTVRCSSGIYSIRFRGRLYIGSAADIQERWRIHSRNLRLGKHHSRHLQRAFNKFPDEQLQFGIIEYVGDLSNLIEREQFYLDLFLPFGRRGYNSCCVAGSVLGLKWNEQSRAAHKARNPQKYLHTPEARAKASASRIGSKVVPELAARRAATFRATIASRPDWGSWNRGAKKSAAHISKMRENARKQQRAPRSEEWKSRISAALKGRKKSPEHIAKMSSAMLGRKGSPCPPETRAKLSNALKGRTFSAEHCARISAAKRGVPRGARANG